LTDIKKKLEEGYQELDSVARKGCQGIIELAEGFEREAEEARENKEEIDAAVSFQLAGDAYKTAYLNACEENAGAKMKRMINQAKNCFRQAAHLFERNNMPEKAVDMYRELLDCLHKERILLTRYMGLTGIEINLTDRIEHYENKIAELYHN